MVIVGDQFDVFFEVRAETAKVPKKLPTQCHQNYCRVTTKHIENNQNTVYVNNPYKMDDKIHQNQFYFVGNAQLFDSSESNEISPMRR